MKKRARGCYRPDNVKEPHQISRYPWLFDENDVYWTKKNEVWCKGLMEQYHMISILCVKSSILKLMDVPFIAKDKLNYLKFFDMLYYHPRMIVEQNPRYKIILPYTLVVRNWDSENPLILMKDNGDTNFGFSRELLLSNQKLSQPLNIARYPVKKLFYKAGNKRIEYMGLSNVEKFYLRPIFLLHWEGTHIPRDKDNKYSFIPISEAIQRDGRLSSIAQLVKNNILKGD